MLSALFITVFLIGLFVLGVTFLKLEWEILGGFVSLLSVIWMIIHLIRICTAPLEYDSFIEKRNAFELTVNNARAYQCGNETNGITQEIALWNSRLAEKQVFNNSLLTDCYYSDKFNSLKPIK